MITYSQALDYINLHAKPLLAIGVKIENAVSMVCAEDINSPETVPPFNNSAMDGFAVKSSMLESVSQNTPLILKVNGSSAAGDELDNGDVGAWEIMTGAPVPLSYDAVVKIEDVEILSIDDNGRPLEIAIKVTSFIKQNIRDAGEDFQIGDKVLKSGEIITPEHIMALASLGIATIYVRKKPSIAVISTGKELVDDIAMPLKSGQIRNSNAPYLICALSAMGVNANYAGTIHDEPQVFEDKINNLLNEDVDIIISTGAVSMGRYDFIPDSLDKIGAEILFHKVAIRPGKPILFAKLPNGAFYFGLPGNPVSAAVGLRFFTYPLIRKLQGLAEESFSYAVLSSNEKKKSGFRFFRKAHAYSHNNGQINIDILEGQESFKIHSLLKANCWAILTEDESEFSAGEAIKIVPLHPNNFILGGKYEDNITALRSVS